MTKTTNNLDIPIDRHSYTSITHEESMALPKQQFIDRCLAWLDEFNDGNQIKLNETQTCPLPDRAPQFSFAGRPQVTSIWKLFDGYHFGGVATRVHYSLVARSNQRATRGNVLAQKETKCRNVMTVTR